MTIQGPINRVFRLLSIKGRASRSELWVIYLTFVCALVGIIYVARTGQQDAFKNLIPLVSALGILTFLCCIRRLHDLNLSGWQIFNPVSSVRLWFEKSAE